MTWISSPDQQHSSFDPIQINTLKPMLAHGPLVQVCAGPDGKPREAFALCLIRSHADRVWSCIRDMRALQTFIKMIESLEILPPGRNQEELIQVNLRFKIAFFSARFHFVARVLRKEGLGIELVFHSGKVKDLIIRLEPIAAGKDCTALRCLVRFDMQSLGWLVNLFVRHHPEIEWGIHAGSALSIADAVRKAVEPNVG